MREDLLQRSFDLGDQEAFALLSGDANPVHVDFVSARRELPGDVVVHGMHCVLCALEGYLGMLASRGITRIHVERLKASFSASIYLDRSVAFSVASEGPSQAKVVATDGDRVVARLLLRWSDATGEERASAWTSTPRAHPTAPREHAFSALLGRHGELQLYLDVGEARVRFPNTMALTSCAFVAEMLALSRLVGMECPGLRSIFSGLDVVRQGAPSQAGSLKYKVENTDDRMALVEMRVAGDALEGSVTSFYRPPPVAQASFKMVSKAVRPDQFRSQTALVVGGSRGLGEITAKIIAAGGGFPVITYFRGKKDAERVVSEIRSGKGTCELLRCDVLNISGELTDYFRRMGGPTHLYPFASPKIAQNWTGTFDRRAFDVFASYYVQGVRRIYDEIRAYRKGPLALFYPSTVLLGEKAAGFEEYVKAKAVGEGLCRRLAGADPNLHVGIKRLPRLATDQTRGLLGNEDPDSLVVMSGALTEFSSETAYLFAGQDGGMSWM
jgi:hypothetical protein